MFSLAINFVRYPSDRHQKKSLCRNSGKVWSDRFMQLLHKLDATLGPNKHSLWPDKKPY